MSKIYEVASYKNECRRLRNMLLHGNMSVEDLSKYADTIFLPFSAILQKGTKDQTDYIDFLYLCLDYYTYTSGVLIDDYDYDMVMEKYKDLGGDIISNADALVQDTQWSLVRHEAPGVVGTVKKVYDEESFDVYYEKHKHAEAWIVGPKYDGISASIKIENCKIVLGTTRYDGVYGQDITPVVQNASNAHIFHKQFFDEPRDGYYKVELVVGTSNFEKLVEVKEYANRRSATSGIVNSPKNLNLAQFLTIIPLAYYNKPNMLYSPLGSIMIDSVGSSRYLMKYVYDIIKTCHSAEFEFRTDGCVIFPLEEVYALDESDLMAEAIAYKINSKVGLTKIKRLYISVGRLGKAVPMAGVIPVEVNETRVSDVSIGSFDKMVSMDLREDEIVEVFSAGDVIPQLRLPEERNYPKHAEHLAIELRCPYCGKKLKSIGKEMFCQNDDCDRIITGRMTNFLQKIGAKNISDATIEDLYKSKLIQSISDIFALTVEDISMLEGYGDVSADNIISELARLRETPLSIDKFFGALGLEGIGEKTARKIFSVIDYDDIFKKSKLKLTLKLQRADGIGDVLAQNFIEGIQNRSDEISKLFCLFNIVDVIRWKGNIVFTGFRDSDAEVKFNQLGYEVSNNVNGKTRAVVCATSDFSSKKCSDARSRNIPIYTRFEMNDLLKELLYQS